MLVRLARAALVPVLAFGLVAGCAEVADEDDFTVVRVPPDTTAPPGSGGSAGGASSSAPATTVPPPRLEWERCRDGLECATLEVPLVHDDPAGGTIELSLARLPASGRNRIGSLLVNPGGPGVPGTDLVRVARVLYSEDLREQFDIVSWDPRGTGRSAGVDCVDDLDPLMSLDPTPDDQAERDRLLRAATDFAEACEEQVGDVLAHISTSDTARDMDLIRQALGEPEISYFGFSYGSELGATYASLFPEHVRAMVLDGALDPSVPSEELSLQQARGNELALGRFLAWCAEDGDCTFKGSGDPGAAFDALMDSLDARPIRAARASGRPLVGQGVAYLAVVQALYLEQLWPTLAEALADAQEGDGSGLLALYDDYLQRRDDGTYTNVIEAFSAITCLDNGASRDVATFEALAERFTAEAPRFGRMFAYNYLCAVWPVDPVPKPTIDAAGAGPILVVAATGDAATPYASSQQLVADLEDGHLLTRDGEGHTSYDPSQRCIVQHVDRYLIDLELPPADTVC